MVFSQTSQKTHSILKVVDLDRLKDTKNQERNNRGVIAGGVISQEPQSPVATTSYSEVFLKSEPVFDSTMFHDLDSEFFQDLDGFYTAPAKEEQVQAIDSPKRTEDRAHNTDNTHTAFSPQGWDAFDANSPLTSASYYGNTPKNLISPSAEGYLNDKFLYPPDTNMNLQFQEKFLDISSLPVVLGDLAPESPVGPAPWSHPAPVPWQTDFSSETTHTMPFINQDNAFDEKFVSVIPREVESNNVVISEYVINESARAGKARSRLAVDVAARTPDWPADLISTPEVLSFVVDELDRDKTPAHHTIQWPATNIGLVTADTCSSVSPPLEYEPITPKSEAQSLAESDADDAKAHKRHRDSEDSDVTYTPYSETTTPRKYKRRKPNVPLKDMILALEGAQQVKPRRGRPPKRRESTVSSMCSVDDSSSVVSNHESKYKELRSKNNDASRRSRMNRKRKELEMEQLALDLEEKNKELKTQADRLESHAKILRDALMLAILNK